MKSAVLIIDVLQDYFRKGRLHAHRKRLIANINALVAFCRAQKIPIIWIRQEFRSDLRDAPLPYRRKKIRVTIRNTLGARLLPELDRNPRDIEFIKKRYSAFFGTRLEAFLKRRRLDTLIIAGVNTHACVRTAAIDAYQRDYDVIVAKDAVDSYDAAHHRITLRYLNGTISSVMTNKEIRQRLATRR